MEDIFITPESSLQDPPLEGRSGPVYLHPLAERHLTLDSQKDSQVGCGPLYLMQQNPSAKWDHSWPRLDDPVYDE